MAVITITKENFAQEVLQSTKPVLLDFWASWQIARSLQELRALLNV